MASFEDLLSVMNNSATNPLGISATDALSITNNKPSKLEQKQAAVASKLQEKQQDLVPVDPFNSVATGSNTNALDLAEASLYRGAGNVLDAAKGASNYLFNTDFDDSEGTGLSNAVNADARAGVSQQYRNQFQDDQMQVLRDIKNDDFLSALGSAANVGVRTLADSAVTLPELAVGSALTAVGGGAITANRLRSMVKTGDNIIEAYKKLPEPSRLGKVAREASKSSIMTADIVQQQRNEYKAENGGEEPSAERLAGMTLLTLATTAWTPKMIEKFYMPKLKRSKQDVGLKEQYKEEVKSYLARAEKGVVYQTAARIAEGIPKVAAAGGAEAVQEYAQFWAETIGTKLQPDEMGGFFEGIVQLANQEGLQDEALQAAFLGGAAGGSARGLTAVPSLAAGTALDTGFKISNAARKQINSSIDKNLSDVDLFKKSAEVEAEQKSAEEKGKYNDSLVEKLNEAETIEDVTDQDLRYKMSEVAKDKDLTDPNTFKAVKNETARVLARETATAKLSVTGKHAKEVSKKTLDKAKETSAKILDEIGIKEEDIDKAVEATKKFSKETATKVKEEYKNFPQSTTLALIEGVTQYSTGKLKEGSKGLQRRAQMAGPKATRAIAKTVEKDAPETAKKLRSYADKIEKAAKSQQQKTDSLTTAEQVPKSIKLASATQNVPDKIVGTTVADILKVSSGEFDSSSTVRTVRQSIAAVKKSREFSNLTGETQKSILNLDDRLKVVEEELTTLPEHVVNKSKEYKAKVIPAIVDNGEKAYEAVRSAIESAGLIMDDWVTKRPEGAISARAALKNVEKSAKEDAPKKHIDLLDMYTGALNAPLSKAKSSQEIDNVVESFFKDFESSPHLRPMMEGIVGKDPKAIQSLIQIKVDKFNDPELSQRLHNAINGKKPKAKAKQDTNEKTKAESTASTETKSTKAEPQQRAENAKPNNPQKVKVETKVVSEDEKLESKDGTVTTSIVNDGVSTEVVYSSSITSEEVDDFIENVMDKEIMCNGK
ncbi:hypothetical protein vBAmePPT11V19_00028 [Alteromonas phage vB_AmeP_PT11-V19]|nr:hypothetical protein vBAmePPT11V19_00028 [Alteromonas phage vB_AmeP_PT11-V19]